MRRFLVFCLGFALLAAPVSAYAAETQEDSASESMPGIEQRLKDARESIMGDRSPRRRITVETLLMKYGIFSTLGKIRHDVGQTLTECGWNHTDMEAGLTADLKAWDADMKALEDKSRAGFEKALSAQKTVSETEFRDYIALLDEYEAYKDTLLNKKIIKTRMSCRSAQNALPQTKEQMTKLVESYFKDE